VTTPDWLEQYIVCVNCHLPLKRHADNQACLFQPTFYARDTHALTARISLSEKELHDIADLGLIK